MFEAKEIVWLTKEMLQYRSNFRQSFSYHHHLIDKRQRSLGSLLVNLVFLAKHRLKHFFFALNTPHYKQHNRHYQFAINSTLGIIKK